MFLPRVRVLFLIISVDDSLGRSAFEPTQEPTVREPGVHDRLAAVIALGTCSAAVAAAGGACLLPCLLVALLLLVVADVVLGGC